MLQSYCVSGVWNEREARFEHCFVPLLVLLPTITASILLLAQALLLVLPRRPRWCAPFVEEPHERLGGGEGRPRRRTALVGALALLSVAGLALQLPSVVKAHGTVESLPPALTWFAAVAMILIHRPSTTPFGVLTILVLQGIVDGIRLVDSNDKLLVSSIVIATLGICVILVMPLRDPEKPAFYVSQPMSSPTSALRSPEDNLTLWQFMTVSWMTPLIRIGYKRQLEDEDVWQLPYEFQHQRLHDNFRLLKGTVIQRLIKANVIDLLILTILGLIELVMQYSGPLLLQQLLRSMEDFTAQKNAAIVYATLIFTVRLIAAQSGVFSLWYGRRCYERSRGEMITMLYEKALNRKIGFAPDTKSKEPSINEDSNGHTMNGNDTMNGDASDKQKLSWWQRIRAKIVKAFPLKKDVETPQKEPASMGKILNLMRNDVYEVAQRFWEFQGLVQKPLSVVFSVTLVVRLLGWSSLLAVLLVVGAQCINAILARVMIYYEKKRRVQTDNKLQVTSQWIEAIRHLRWYGWQDAWLSQIMDARQRELNLRIITSIWNLAISACNSLALDLTPVISFFAYTVIAGKPLRVDVAFPAMQLFSMLTSSLRDLPNLIIVIINAWVAVGRIEEYMAEPDRDQQETEPVISGDLSFNTAQFAWPGTSEPVVSLNMRFPKGLTVVCGEVASGKTAMLQALLGELDKLSGFLLRPNEPIAYCAQTPWLQSMSIRENIIFGEHYDEDRYMQVLQCCALIDDLKDFKAGDLSLIGENGVGLSGGQRARVALARAIYSHSNIMLLDDPLASLDQQTAEHIGHHLTFDKLFKDRIVILVTHRTDIVGPLATRVIRMSGGEATVLDEEAMVEDASESAYQFREMKRSYLLDQTRARDLDVVPDKFMEDEHRAQGGVKASVYWEYIKAGNLAWWAALVPILAVYRLFAIGSSWFLKSWGEAYNQHTTPNFLVQLPDVVATKSSFVDGWPAPDVNIKPWLVGFALLALGQSLAFILSQGMMIVIVYTAGKNMFREIMAKVAGATFRFYDITPVGRLMNRMTSDISVIDGNISQQFQSVAWLSISWISSLIVIGSVTPSFLVFALFLTIAFIGIFLRFIPTSQSLRRLEMVSLTPLMSNFGALLDGLVTVRAFRVQRQFQDRVVRVVDTFQKMDHFYWSLQAWLMYRYDILSASSTLLLTLLALHTNVSAGLTAFVLIAANKLVTSTHILCRQYGQLQMNFVSVERIVELLHLEQEPKGVVDPPAWWPQTKGDITFGNVTIRYAPHMENAALRDISLRIKGGKRTVILGRTGSGKTTLALSLLATIVPESGKIEIDGIDLSDINRQALRSRITFLAQEPVLFPGTMRQNLDPLEEYTDHDCQVVLDKVCRVQDFKLDTRIEAGGRNLSQGQRQLVALARAVLRQSAIVILDEATASIDFETADQIQEVLSEELKGSTVIVIAHRVDAARHANLGVVLAGGVLLKQFESQELSDPAQLEQLHTTLTPIDTEEIPGVDNIDEINATNRIDYADN